MMIKALGLVGLSPDTGAWLEALINASVKGAIILVVAILLSYGLRRASSSARHLVWNLALSGLLVLPVLSFFLPIWHTPLLPTLQAEESAVEPVSETYSQGAIPQPLTVGGDSSKSFDLPPVSKFPEMTAAQSARSEPSAKRTEAISQPAWTTWAVIIWLAGALIVLIRLFIGTAHVWWMARCAREITHGAWASPMEDIRFQLRLTRHVTLLESLRVTMPLTWGFLRPVILLPVDAERWSAERRSVVLLHELAHVKRRDCLTQMLAQLACALYWFNPLVWLAARHLRIERERACDDYVLEAGTKASDYADHLLDIARSFEAKNCSTLVAVAIARRSQLEDRLLAILDPKTSRRRLNPLRVILVGIFSACLILPLAAMHPTSQAQSTNREAAVEPSAQEPRNQKTVSEPGSVSERSEEPEKENKVARSEVDTEEPVSDRTTEPSEPVAEREAEPQEPKDNSRVVEALKEALKDEDAGVRQHALFALGQLGDNSAVDGLIEALKDSDWQVRKKAAWALGLRGGERAMESLIDATKDANPQVREQAVWALGMRGNGKAIDALIAALRDENRSVREQTAWALGMRGNGRSVEALMDTLKDESAQVRAQAAWALGMRGDSRAVDALTASLKDESAQVRAKAAWALGMKGNRNAVNALIAALQDGSPQVRAEAAWALGMKGDLRAGDALNAALKDENRQVRQKAAWALGMVLMRN